jgi:transcriptional regulator with XRE-family HTH domain
MPAKILHHAEQTRAQLEALGEQIRLRRKSLGVNATLAAQAAGLSRVTLYRIEKGEPTVTIGAWANACAALGMMINAQDVNFAQDSAERDASLWIPARIPLTDYPQLQALAWQLHGVDALSPMEAHGMYERNARHLDTAALTEKERALMRALDVAFGGVAANTDV